MAELSYDNARALLYDPVAGNLAAARAMLMQLGFRKLQGVREVGKLADLAAQGECDLLMAEVAGADGDILDVVRRIRAGELGPNPFVVVLLTSWERSVERIQAAIDSGADDLLLRPHSAAALAQRVTAAVNARKAFVVTGDYIGPDRRKDPSARPGAEGFLAPNTLKAAASGDAKALAEANREIAKARLGVERERIKRLAMRVATAARLRLEGDGFEDRHGGEEIDRAARELRRRLRDLGPPEAEGLAVTLVELTSRLIGSEPPSPDQLQLVRELAIGAYAAFAGQDEAQSTRGELDSVVSAIRARMKRQDGRGGGRGVA